MFDVIDLCSNAERVRLCRCNGLLLAVLARTGDQVVYVPGRLVNWMAGAYAGEGKTDAKDARTIAETARLRRDLTTVAATDPVIARCGC